MELTDKEIEFLKVIHEAEERGYPVTFNYRDEEKVNEYLQLYGDAFNSLKLAFVFTGAITCGSELKLTEKGRTYLEKALLKKEKELERKNLELEVERKITERKYKPWEIAFAVIGGISALIVLIEHVVIRIINLISP